MRLTIATISTLFIFYSHAQTASNKTKSLSFEIGKTGLIYSFIYDQKFTSKNAGFRFGAGTNFAKYLSANSFGGGYYRLFGKHSKYFELGADLQYLDVFESSDDQRGFSFVYPDYSIKTWYASLNIGFRSYGKKSLFRLGLSPGFIKKEFINGGYISLGVLF